MDVFVPLGEETVSLKPLANPLLHHPNMALLDDYLIFQNN